MSVFQALKGTHPAGWTVRITQTMDAQKIANAILAKLNLPEDLRGRVVNVVSFPDEETCHAFYPGRSRDVHEHACAVVKMEVRKRRGDIRRTIVPLHKATDIVAQEQRTAVADRHNYLVPLPQSVPMARTGQA
jgi:hypothetical protein